jgi:hypothetical protein
MVDDNAANFGMQNVLAFLNLHSEHCINEKFLRIISNAFLFGKEGDGTHNTKQITLTLF